MKTKWIRRGLGEQGDRGSNRVTPGVYGIHEDGRRAADEEFRRSSQAAARTRQLSSSANGSWGFPPARVGRRRAIRKSS